MAGQSITVDAVTRAKLDGIREATGAVTYGEVVRNAVKAYCKELAAEKKAEAEAGR